MVDLRRVRAARVSPTARPIRPAEDRNPFIETEEREELFEALNAIVDDAEAEYGRTFDTTRQHLMSGVESVRNW